MYNILVKSKLRLTLNTSGGGWERGKGRTGPRNRKSRLPHTYSVATCTKEMSIIQNLYIVLMIKEYRLRENYNCLFVLFVKLNVPFIVHSGDILSPAAFTKWRIQSE